MSVEVDRDQVLAYRVAAQELVVGAGPRREPAVLDLGVQDTPYGSARLALAAREAEPPGDETLTLVWSIRGAPHLHRPADLPALTTALWPLSDADATARIKSTQIKEGARLGLAAFTATAEALRAVVTAPMNKGDVSTGVSARVPKALTYWCQSCQAQHISGELFQQAGLAGGVRVEPRGRGTTLAPIAPRPALPAASAGIETLVETYLRLLGPAGPAEVADFLGTTPAVVRQVWPGKLGGGRGGGGPPPAA